MNLQLAYLSEGRLFFKEGDEPARLIESPFAQSMLDRDVRDRQRHGWKTSGAGAGMPNGFLWSFGRGRVAQDAVRRIRINGVSRGLEKGDLTYVLETDRTSGLFLYNIANGEERRLVHRKDFQALHLCRHPTLGLIACSAPAKDGTAHIAVMEADGSRLRDVTEGDALDENPTWVPGPGSQIVFQSTGIGRNQAGFVVGHGPAAIMKLDLDRGDFASLLEDERTDHLLPRMGDDGSLYCIRRPHEAFPQPGLGQMVLDVVAFPYRLFCAILGFLNVFSQMFSGEPLTRAGGPKMEMPDARFLMLQGKLIDAQKAARNFRGERSLVPASWELMRRDSAGKVEVLAKRVASYDLCGDGGVVYTDGFTIYHRSADGTSRKVCQDKVIEHVVVVNRG